MMYQSTCWSIVEQQATNKWLARPSPLLQHNHEHKHKEAYALAGIEGHKHKNIKTLRFYYGYVVVTCSEDMAGVS